jgi:serine/threonine protein kinase
MEKIDDFTLISRTQQESFWDIYLTSKEGTETKYVTKVIKKEKIWNNDRKYIDGEISILKDINHPNLVKLIEVKENAEYIYIIFEYCNGGDLQSFLDKYVKENNKGLSEEIVQYIMKQLIDAFKYLHNKRIIHRGIKLYNILINYDDENDKLNSNIMKARIKITNFEFSKYLQKGQLAKTFVGTPLNMSPLLLKKQLGDENNKNKGYDTKEDIWSLGISFYQLLIGKSPFDAENITDLLDKVEKGIYMIPSTLSKEAISFMNSMLQYDSNKRLTIEKLCEHKFLKKNVKEFSKIDINEIKDLLKDSYIEINTKSNDSIWKVVGH